MLTSLSALENLTLIGSGHYIWIDNNNALTSLTGLDNIDASQMNGLLIYDNISLSLCEVQSICDYLVNPSGDLEIYNNAPGCNNPEEVEEACESVSVETVDLLAAVLCIHFFHYPVVLFFWVR